MYFPDRTLSDTAVGAGMVPGNWTLRIRIWNQLFDLIWFYDINEPVASGKWDMDIYGI